MQDVYKRQGFRKLDNLVVIVDNNNQIVQFAESCPHGSFPDLAFQMCIRDRLSRFFVLLSFSATAYLLYLIKSVLSRTFFIFLRSFLSIGFVRSVILNATTLISYHVLFCLSIIFFIFQKINNQVSFSRPSKSACLSQWTFILPLLSGYVNTFFLSIKNS